MIVFFDVDGTIVDDDTQQIPESAVRAVEQLRRNGHLAVVNTGRPFGHIDPRVKAMAFSGWIAACGMQIQLDGKWLHLDLPDHRLCCQVRQAVRECGMQVLYEAEDALVRDGECSVHPRVMPEIRRLSARNLPIVEMGQGHDFVKFCTYDAPGCRREEFVERMKPWFTATYRANTMIEFVKNGNTKAKGMELLVNALGYDRSQVYAIGDTTNDLPMFRFAAHSACMGGGMEEAKKAAEFVTADLLSDGVEKAMQHFGLI